MKDKLFDVSNELSLANLQAQGVLNLLAHSVPSLCENDSWNGEDRAGIEELVSATNMRLRTAQAAFEQAYQRERQAKRVEPVPAAAPSKKMNSTPQQTHMKNEAKISASLVPNRGSWTKLVVNVQTGGSGLRPYFDLAKSNGIRWCDFVANALFVGARNLEETGDVFSSAPRPPFEYGVFCELTRRGFKPNQVLFSRQCQASLGSKN